MVEESAFRGVILFLEQIGIYDVVLPFLLIFTIVFAILEKTKVFGTDEINGVKYTKKNLNSITAFAIGFIVVASTTLVRVVNEVMANMVLLLLLSVCFLILIGSFFKEDEDVFLKEGPWRTFFMILMFIGMVVIFTNAFGWLGPAWDWLVAHWQTNFVATIVLLLFIALFMYYIVGGGTPEKQSKKKESES